VLLFVLLYFWEQTRVEPYVRFAVFRNTMFTVASLNAAMRMFLMSSINFVIPLYLSDVHNSSYNVIGLALALQAGALFATSQLGGRLADRWGSRRPAALSMIGLILVMAFLAFLPAAVPVWIVLLSTTAHGLLVGLSLAPLHRAAMHGVIESEMGMAAGLYSMLRFAGQILGYASAGVLLQSGLERLAAPILAYQLVFWLFAAAALVGAVFATQLRES
jgi:MFS family permease